MGVVVTAEDGTQGLGISTLGRPLAALVDDYLGPRIIGEPALATERIYDMMLRLCSPFGATGIASYAVSAIDLALWDLKGKVLDRPVYELLGGPARDEIVCYATGPQHEWHMELGFTPPNIRAATARPTVSTDCAATSTTWPPCATSSAPTSS